MIKSLRSLLDAEECLFNFLSLRVVREIERETLGSARQNSISATIEFEKKKSRSKSVDSKPSNKNKVADEGQENLNRQETLKNKKLQDSRKQLEKIFDRIPTMSIFAPMIADLHFDFGEDHPINLQLVTLQILLSKLLTEVMTWKAGNVLLSDICNLSRGTSVEQVKNFLYLL